MSESTRLLRALATTVLALAAAARAAEPVDFRSVPTKFARPFLAFASSIGMPKLAGLEAGGCGRPCVA